MEWLKDGITRFGEHLKGSWRSKMIWFNGAVTPLLVVYWPDIWDAVQQFQGVLPDNKWQALLYVNAGVNAILRFNTHKALADK